MSHQALGPQFRFIEASGSNPEATSYYHQIRHVESRKTSLAWHKETGEIFSIQTAPELRRQGMATKMWRGAHRISAADPSVVPPRHSRIRSDEGEAWAQSVGGELPPRRTEETT